MAAIGRALGDLTDPTARQRVLRWACERFAVDAVQAPAALSAASAVAPSADAHLAVDNLTDMFAAQSFANEDDSLSVEPPPAVVETAKTEKTSLETAIRSFAADFQRFADDWNGAAA